MRNAIPIRSQVLGLGLALFSTGVARGDSPPMPPCPPGWEQVDKFTCREPFPCPPGWKLDAGPVCRPWECDKASDCNWKGFIPCREAEVCAPTAGGRAVRVCDPAGTSPRCPSGLSCQPRRLCANFPASAPAVFANWTPGATDRTTTPPAAPEPKAATPSTGATAPVSPPAEPKKSGCSYVGSAGSAAPPTGLWLSLLVLGWAMRRRLGRPPAWEDRQG